MVEKLQNKAREPKIAIVDDDNGHVPQPQKPTRRIPPRDPKPGLFVKIHPDRPKPPKQPVLPRLIKGGEKAIRLEMAVRICSTTTTHSNTYW